MWDKDYGEMAMESYDIDSFIDGRKRLVETARLKIRASEELVKKYKAQIAAHMIREGRNQIKSENYTIKKTVSKGQVEVFDLEALPVHFLRTRAEIAPDKIAIKEAIVDKGETVAGAKMTYVPDSVRLE